MCAFFLKERNHSGHREPNLGREVWLEKALLLRGVEGGSA